MKHIKSSLIAFTFLVICSLLAGCVHNRGKSFNGIKASFQDGDTNGVARVTLDTNGVLIAEVTGAQSVVIGGDGKVALGSLFATTALRGAAHNRKDLLGGTVQTTASDIEGDPDAEAIGATGTAAGNLIQEAINP